jgi:hypothetical protein
MPRRRAWLVLLAYAAGWPSLACVAGLCLAYIADVRAWPVLPVGLCFC